MLRVGVDSGECPSFHVEVTPRLGRRVHLDTRGRGHSVNTSVVTEVRGAFERRRDDRAPDTDGTLVVATVCRALQRRNCARRGTRRIVASSIGGLLSVSFVGGGCGGTMGGSWQFVEW